jgi:endogenous inhibitor of DNA gyrase (YacG/DUF329 family)
MADQPADKDDAKERGKCPICDRPSEPRYAPFCSRRCADVDLARWLRGAYAIPDEAESEDGDENALGRGSDPGSDPAGLIPKGNGDKG